MASKKDRENARVREVITREFGTLLQIVERTKNGGSVTRRDLLRAETLIKMALNHKTPKSIMVVDRALERTLVRV